MVLICRFFILVLAWSISQNASAQRRATSAPKKEVVSKVSKPKVSKPKVLKKEASKKEVSKEVASPLVASQYIIKDVKCSYQIHSAGRWAPSKVPFKVGQEVWGLVSGNLANELLFRTPDGKKYRVNLSCVEKKTKRSFFDDFSVFALSGFSSWQDTMTITDKLADLSSPLRVTNAAICVGFGLSVTRKQYSYGVDSCAFYGKAHISNSEEASLVAYAARNADIYGVQNNLRLLWLPPAGNVEFGLALPIYLKTGTFPLVTADSEITPKFRLLWGAMMEARFIRGRFVFVQNVGFLGKMSNFLWNIQGAYYF